VKAPIHRFLGGWPEDVETVWLDDPSSGFHADPFAFRMDGRDLLLTEHVREPGERGEIVVRELENGLVRSSPRSVLRLPIHVSYPYLIESEGGLYCIPETIQANAVLLFRVVGPELAIVPEARLIDGFAAADNTIVRRDGRYWLFCTRHRPGTNASNSELHLWYAEKLTGPWQAHPMNPVKKDASNARPAGTPFVYEGQLYRPAQDCSRRYGEQVHINRVVTLSPYEFAEEKVATIGPRRHSKYPDGFHHISSFGEWTLVDGACAIRDELSVRDQGLPPPEGGDSLALALSSLAAKGSRIR
jgi:hypothetical protein